MNSILGVSPINTIAQNQALAWVVALRADNLSNEVLDDFAGWLAESESHREAWSWALDTWETLGVVSHLKTESLLMTEVATPAFQWLRSAFSVDALRNRLLPAAMAFSLVLTLAAVALFKQAPEPDVYRTAVGEYLEVVLADGSVVELNTDTALTVSFSDSARDIALLKGEAFFTVAKDPQRPFVVDIDGPTVRAIGTAFNIYRLSDDLAKVSVVEGIVRVAEKSDSAAMAVKSKFLTVDETIEIDSVTGLAEPQLEATAALTSWRHGQLLFDNTSLAQAVTMLNRYLEKKVVIGDAVANNIKISGTFSSRQNKETLVAVAQALQLEIKSDTDKWVLFQSIP